MVIMERRERRLGEGEQLPAVVVTEVPEATSEAREVTRRTWSTKSVLATDDREASQDTS